MKYIGSKNKISKQIVPILQKYIDENNIKSYIEPFVGGANIIDKIECESRRANDIETLLVELFKRCLSDDNFLDSLPELPSREHYFNVRDNPNNYSIAYRAAILYFASYNSRINGGCYGAYANTKEGKMRNYFQEAKKNLKKQIPFLKDVSFTNLDYQKLKIERSLVYCDIPYEKCYYRDKVYNKDGFSHKEFWGWTREQSKNNIVIVSEYNAPDDFDCIWEQEIKTHMNNVKHQKRVEKLFIMNNN